MSAEDERERAETVWTSLVAQEGAALAPERSIGRQSLRDRAAREPAVAIDELPRVSASGPHPDIEVLEPIGKGGMGQVDLVRQRCLRREVAQKRLHAEVQGGDAQALIREALHAGALEHPNIVPVHLLGRDEQDLPVLLMKRVSGIEWLELIEDPEHPRWAELPADRLQFHLDVLRQVCNAVHYAHSRGLLHRDIKPANVMLGSFGEVYLLDWGLSVPLDEPRPASAPIVGTPAYFAPELVDVTRPLSARTDVYLLGATLHHALTRRPRHTSGPDGTRSVVISAFHSRPFAYEASVPAELAALCNRATHRDPAERPESALAFRQRLEEYAQHRGSVRTCDSALRALEGLRQLRAGPAPVEPERLVASFAAARTGFEHALEDWPGNAAARDGLQACLELRIEHELEQRNKGTVRELLLGLPRPRPDLEARLEVLRAELEEEARSRERLRSMQVDLDVTGAGRTRAALFLRVGALAGAGLLGCAVLTEVGYLGKIRSLQLGFQVALPVVYALGVSLARRSLLETTGARKIAACAGLLMATPLMSTLIALAIEPVNKTALASYLQTAILAVMAIAFDGRIGWIGLVTGLVALGCSRWRAHYLEIQGVGTVLAFAVAARVTQPRTGSAEGGKDGDPTAGDRP